MKEGKSKFGKIRAPRRGPEGRLWFVADLDGPINGQLIANCRMLSLLETSATMTVLPLGASGWRKILAALKLTGAAMASEPQDRLYLSLPGQRGGWLLLASLILFRLRGANLFLHHHSYRNMRAGPTWLGCALARAAGPRAVHILLSQAMAAAYAKRYLRPGAARPVTLSNAALLPPPAPPGKRHGPLAIGFLGAWTKEKGVDHVLAVVERLLQDDSTLRFTLAGAPPVKDDPIIETITAMAARWPDRFSVQGWLDGAEKSTFFDRLDCLLLPSSLPDEAEPLTMLEAFSAGVEVMATPIGAIPERIRSPDCLLSLDIETDCTRIVRLVARRRADRDASTRECREHAVRLHSAGLPARDALLARLTETSEAISSHRISITGSQIS
ncbi:glycosyltransferase family 4 protein [Rhizobium sp. FKL33]|uniref:glycosyltransferase family 4 protein n=1 Tax=Rhizobium sp. FKL33 TaxID=2562307 RepID=UPI0010C052E0|nr:glycosyltransferase family 4 protein [Rhizobium sp. FKL33]